jgi:hypothetical protein
MEEKNDEEPLTLEEYKKIAEALRNAKITCTIF